MRASAESIYTLAMHFTGYKRAYVKLHICAVTCKQGRRQLVGGPHATPWLTKKVCMETFSRSKQRKIIPPLRPVTQQNRST